LKEKVAALVKKIVITAVGIRHGDHVAPLYHSTSIFRALLASNFVVISIGN
jgi:hypothetical protein